jgi:drug/metabolite transporter (DMT)-like permease
VLSFVAIWSFWAGIDRLHPAVAGFLGRSETLVSIALGVVLLGERFRPTEGVGAAVAIGGIVVMKVPAALEANVGEGTGHWLVMLGAASFGAAEAISKIAARRTRPETFVFWRNLVLVPVFGIAVLIGGGLERPTGTVLLSAAAVALLAPTLARLTYMHALRAIDLAKAAVVNQLQPVFTLLLALAAYRTVPRPLEALGGALILTGVVLLAWTAGRDRSARASGRGAGVL